MQAVIDLGTNTFHLMIATVGTDGIVIHEKKQIPVKIGTGGIHQNYITPASMERAIDALMTFKQLINQYPVFRIKAFATAAIRDAENAAVFISKVKQLTDIDIQTISGDLEAQLIYTGVTKSLPAIAETYLIVDIGGGSVECIMVQKQIAVWQKSFRAGASLILHRFEITDPISAKTEQDIEHFFELTFEELVLALAKYQPKYMVGSAGSFESLVEIATLDFFFSTKSISLHAQELTIQDAQSCINRLIYSTTEQRKLLKGLVTFRLEMIVPSMLLKRWLIQSSGVSKLICSAYSLKEGMLFHSTN
jgi:exopolyphosphatase/guanosine-5'-triphosphate,3'-diphosphate pyrophosphatase